MPQVINTNMMSLNAQRALNRSQNSMQTSMEKLSSGLRINRAKDDAAGLAISERINSQVRGLDQAVRNANDGISMLQTAEGALEEVNNALQRMRELAIQAKNGTNTHSDRVSLDDEFFALRMEIIRISDVTEFNNNPILGSTQNTDLQIGWENGSSNTVRVSFVDIRNESFAVGGLANLLSVDTNLWGPQGSVNGINVDRTALAAWWASDPGMVVHASTDSAIAYYDAIHISEALSYVTNAIDAVSKLRADFGAIQNRLESAARNMLNVSENQSAARSLIQDADYAKETANMTRTQILQQAGTTMLAQANQLPENVLSLLNGQ